MRRIFAIVLLACASALVADSQTPERFTKQVNVDGWSIPPVKNLKVGKEGSIELEGTSVVRTSYILGENAPSIPIPGSKFCEFRTLRSFRFNDKVFAIEGWCVIFSIQTTRSKRLTVSSKTYAAAMTVYTLVDEDRNGDFESQYNSSEYLDFAQFGGNRPLQ